MCELTVLFLEGRLWADNSEINENVIENNNGDENYLDELDENNEGNKIEGQHEDRRRPGRAVRVLDF